MASVVGKTKKQTTVLIRIGRCLRGLIDGKAVYRYVREKPHSIDKKSNPISAWIEDGYYSRNILDE